MTYEELNEMVKDWQNVGNLRVATENGNTSLHSDTGITPTVARNINVSVWNELPRLFEEVRVLVDDHERMSAFLRVIQQISTDSMRCTLNRRYRPPRARFHRRRNPEGTPMWRSAQLFLRAKYPA